MEEEEEKLLCKDCREKADLGDCYDALEVLSCQKVHELCPSCIRKARWTVKWELGHFDE